MSTLSREQARNALFTALGEIAPEVDPATLAYDRPLREQVDIDSFDFLNVMIRLRELTGVSVPESDYAQLTTLDAAIDYLVGH
jgi:acyl carrier protein